MKFLKYIGIVSLVIVFLFAAFVAVAPARAWDGGPIEFDWGAISLALQNLVLAILPVLGALVARWLNVKFQIARGELSDDQRRMLDVFIRTMVFAAEQMKLTDAIDNKLDYVEMMVDGWLSRHNVDMDWEEIRARIEAAVKQEFPKPPAMG